ncbi:uncharacterized protein LOC143892480 [Tasmannia lanceolata]|uniref:uncharacterized protein LOC143892480 n=1 Tax=Tasmannia lanceolata TaxID=3420 RepID=UPI0040630E33
MEPVAPPGGTTHNYPDSLDSSPRSRLTDSWEEPLGLHPGAGNAPPAKLRLMCSYGGHIVPRPTDKSLCYLGGETRIVVIDRNTSLSDLSSKLSQTLLEGRAFSLKYQLPNEDLDSLISLTTDEDLDNMIDEYDRTTSSLKSSRLRLFLFESKPDSASSLGSLLEDSKSETWFVDALNGSGIMPRGLSGNSSSNTINCLLGLEDSGTGAGVETLPDNSSNKPRVDSVPDSPMLENTSSFGSTSSAAFLSNLPPIRVHVDDGVRAQDAMIGLDESFSYMNVSAKQDEGFKEGGFHVLPPVVVTENPNPNRVLSEDERSEHSISGSMRKPPQAPPQSKPNTVDVLTTDTVTRDNLPGVVSRPKTLFYQDPVPVPIGNSKPVSDPKMDGSDPNYRIPVQVQDQSFMVTMPPEQQQFIHTNPHYFQHSAGPVPISYYQMHPMQQHHQQPPPQLDQQYPMYFFPVRQNPPYNIPLQSNLGDGSSIPSGKAAPPTNPPMYKEPPPIYPTRSAAAPPPKPELAANMYRTAASAASVQAMANPQLIQFSDQPQQFMGYHHMQHPSQTMATAGNFGYEFADPLHAQQIFYTQPTSTTMAPQYQTMSSVGALISENSMQQPVDTKQNRA